jgi:hypothetical protein
MTMTKNDSKPERSLSDQEKQKIPLKGEVSPEEAGIKALAFATQVQAQMTPKKR